MKRHLSFLILAFVFLFVPIRSVWASQPIPDTYSFGMVVGIIEEREYEEAGRTNLYQRLNVDTDGNPDTPPVEVESGLLPSVKQTRFVLDDRIVFTESSTDTGEVVRYVSDVDRRSSLAALAAIAFLAAILVGRWKGLASIAGMAFSFAVIFRFILPRILSGADPVMTAITGSLLIIPVTFVLSHGYTRKTLVAMAGTAVSLVVTGILSVLFVRWSFLSGFASEEMGFLDVMRQGAVDAQGLLLAGILIGSLGVLDDITVSQSALVEELKIANPAMGRLKLFRSAMNVGRDHIASMVNTLVLVYAGASLPLLLLFLDSSIPSGIALNTELVAEEVVRTLVGSIGLILAVPFTTLLSVFAFKKPQPVARR